MKATWVLVLPVAVACLGAWLKRTERIEGELVERSHEPLDEEDQ